MAELNPLEPRVNDPELEADLIRLLSITGPLGTIRVADIVIPTVSLGDVVTRTVRVEQPAFRSTDVFSAGVQTAAPANFIHADTGPLAAGAYDVHLQIPHTLATSHVWQMGHRNATNTANLAFWSTLLVTGAGGGFTQTFAYELGLNERLTILSPSAFDPGEGSVAFIFARRRT